VRYAARYHTAQSSKNFDMRTLKKSLLQTLKTVGIFRTLDHSAWRNNKLLILCYHGISLEDEHECEGLYGIERGFVSLPYGNLAHRRLSTSYRSGMLWKNFTRTACRPGVSLSRSMMAMYNFYARAFPILQEYGISRDDVSHHVLLFPKPDRVSSHVSIHACGKSAVP
jgi:hypothetical protein